MKEHFKAIIWRNALDRFDVMMHYQCQDGTFRDLFSADHVACSHAAYLQRKSRFHEVAQSFHPGYEVILYDYVKKAFPKTTDITCEFDVAITGISNVSKNALLSFLSAMLNATQNADICGTLTIECVAPHKADTPTTLVAHDITDATCEELQHFIAQL